MRFKGNLLVRIVPLCGLSFILIGCDQSGSGADGAKRVATTSVVATGGIECDDARGAITFSPPLTDTTPGVATVDFTVSDCTTAKSNAYHVTSGTVRATIADNREATCLGILTSKPVTATIEWAPNTIRRSVLRFSGYAIVAGTGGDEGFQLPNSTGSVSVEGSFAGRNRGATTLAMVVSTETPAYLLGACSSATGLATLMIGGGRLALS